MNWLHHSQKGCCAFLYGTGRESAVHCDGEADLERAFEGALSAQMRNMCEAGTSANWFLVHDSVANDFADILAANMSLVKVGGGT